VRFEVSETMLECLDDYLSSRGQNGSDEEGLRALEHHFPKLTLAQKWKVVRRWRREMKEADKEGRAAGEI